MDHIIKNDRNHSHPDDQIADENKMANAKSIDELTLTKGLITDTRIESNSMGTIEVPADHYWGAQTQRSLLHFSIGNDGMPKAVYHAYGYVKKAAAKVNAENGILSRDKADLIMRVADEIISGLIANFHSTSGKQVLVPKQT